jgi:hypothetical protein
VLHLSLDMRHQITGRCDGSKHGCIAEAAESTTTRSIAGTQTLKHVPDGAAMVAKYAA